MKRVMRTLTKKAEKLAEMTVDLFIRGIEACNDGEISEEDYVEILDHYLRHAAVLLDQNPELFVKAANVSGDTFLSCLETFS